MRTFVAVEISDNQIIDSIEKFQSRININAKAVDPHNLHFTLQFLGDVSENDAQKISKALQTIEFSRFKVSLKGVGVFPKLKFPRVIWVGTNEDGGKKLIELANKVQKALLPLGFTSDKPFKPHITIFRVKNKIEDIGEKLEKEKDVDFGVQDIASVKFKQSILTPKGPVYSDIKEIVAKWRKFFPKSVD